MTGFMLAIKVSHCPAEPGLPGVQGRTELSCANYHAARFDKGTECQEDVLNRANFKRAVQLVKSME